MIASVRMAFYAYDSDYACVLYVCINVWLRLCRHSVAITEMWMRIRDAVRTTQHW